MKEQDENISVSAIEQVYKDRINAAKSDAAKELNKKTFNNWNFLQKKDLI